MHLIVEWNLEYWNRLEKNLIIRSFKSCGLNLKMDVSEDHLIQCFKEGQPYASGLDMLKEQQVCYRMQNISRVIPLKSRRAIERRQNNSEDDLIDIEL